MLEHRKYIDALDNRRREIENQVDSKNPFDAGVMRAIEASKKSLALNTDQEHRAIRKGLHMFSDALTKQYGDPRFRERDGTIGKVASLGPAMSAGLEGYEAEGEKIQHDMKEVLEVARKIRDSEIKRLREQDKDAFDAYFKDKQLGLEYEKLLEQEKYHQGLLDNKNQKETPFDKKHKLGMEGLTRTIDEATNTINRNKALAEATGTSSKGEVGFAKRMFNDNWLSKKIGTNIQLTPEQQEIETMGSLLAGYGNKLMNFTNQVEFESLPHISPTKSDDANLAILQKMKQIMIRDAEEHGSIGSSGAYNNPSSSTIMPDRFAPRAVNVDEAFDEDDYGDL